MLEFRAGNADGFRDGQRLHLLEMDVQVNDWARGATGARTGTSELNCERDERTELVDEDADAVDGLRFRRQTGRLLQVLFAVGYEAGAARQRHLQLSLMGDCPVGLNFNFYETEINDLLENNF